MPGIAAKEVRERAKVARKWDLYWVKSTTPTWEYNYTLYIHLL